MQKKVLMLLKEKPDVLQWAEEDVAEWLRACELERYESNFKRARLNGYALVQIRDYDLEAHLKVNSLGHRKKLVKYLYLLKALWISLSNKDAHGLNLSEKSSII